MAGPLLPALLVISAVSAGLQFKAGKDAANQQRKANSIQRQQQDAGNRQERLNELNRARRLRAEGLANAEGAGIQVAGQSTSGAVNSVTSQSAGNQAFLRGQNVFANKAGQRLDNASAANTRADAFGFVNSLSAFAFDNQDNINAAFGKELI